MSYEAPNPSFRFGDTWEYSDGEFVHAFLLQYQQPNQPSAGDEAGALGHAISRDLLHWETLPAALKSGNPGSYDDLEIWTGCTIREGDTTYLYYTSRKSPNGHASISLATSKDDLHFEKHPENPILIPDAKYYFNPDNPCTIAVHGNNLKDSYDCRDLCAVKDPSGDFWWGFFAARQPSDSCPMTSVIGLAKSYDLIHWEQLPPCFVPNRHHCVETPDVFFMNGKWYMLCLAGNIYGQRRCTDDDLPFPLITIYAVADRPEGPYTEPENNALLTTMAMSGNCAKTVLHKGKRYLFHLEVNQLPDGVFETAMSLPKEVVCDESGRLKLYLVDNYREYFESDISVTAPEKDLRWGSRGVWETAPGYAKGICVSDWSVQPFEEQYGNFVLETDLSAPDAESAGFVFGLGSNIFEGGLVMLLDYRQNRVFLTASRTFEIIDGKSLPLSRQTMHLTLIVNEKTVELYLNGKLALTRMTTFRNMGGVGYFVEHGSAVFENTVIHPLKPF